MRKAIRNLLSIDAAGPTTAILAVFVLATAVSIPAAERAVYHSTADVAWSPDGRWLAVADATGDAVAIVDAQSGEVARTIDLVGEPMSLVWNREGDRLYVALMGANAVAELDPAAGTVVRRLGNAGAWPVGMALAPERNLLVVANAAVNQISLLDLGNPEKTRRIAVGHQPRAVAVTADESLAVVGNLLPFGPATEVEVASAVSLIDLEEGKKVAEVALPGGSTMLRGVAVSADGRWAYIAHTLGHFTLPTTQLDRGWVNTNCVSIIDLADRQRYATLLLDLVTEGAADPWGIAPSADGSMLYVAVAGTHEIAKIRLAELHRLLTGEEEPKEILKDARSIPDVWNEIHRDPKLRDRLAYNLAALYAADLLERIEVPVKGPREIALSPDGKTLAVGGYFSGNVLLVHPESMKARHDVALGSNPEPDEIRKGEIIFHDGTHCFQHWLSCSTCHPDARADALNWDLLNDGIGNPKNTKSLMYSHKTPPMMSRGVRESLDVTVNAGFKFIQFRVPEPGEAEAVSAYLRSLEPAVSPHRNPDGSLTEKAQRGRAIFESEATACSRCHPAPLYTDMKLHDVGTRRPLDKASEFDTPTLLELWRTGPYLHNGEAVTLEEVLVKFNAGDHHGKTSHLSKEEIAALVAYLLSL